MAARKKSGMSKSKRKPMKKKAASSVKRKTAKTAKRTTAKKAPSMMVAKKASGPVSVGRKPFSKSQFISEISDRTGVARKAVVEVLDTISHIISAHLNKQGPEIFSWPGMFKIQVIKKPATKARQGTNPFTGETMMFKAKPASRRVKVRPLKQLKEMAG